MRFFKNLVVAIAVSSLLFIPFIGKVHLFDWDEINFAEIAREMVVSGNYLNAQIDFRPFTEKPPFFMWLQAISMHLFGVSEFAARLPNAFLGILVSAFLLWFGKRIISLQFAWIWVVMWWASILPHLYFKSGIIDPWFNFLIFLSFISIISHYHSYNKSSKSISKLLLAGLFSGLAILTKGPVALLVISLVAFVYWIFERFRWYLPFWHFIVYLLTSLGTFGVWLLIDYSLNGPEFLIEFTIRQWELLTTPDAGHRGFFGYHIVVLLFGCFPASVFFTAWYFDKKNRQIFDLITRDYIRWMSILFFVVLILFSIVKTKIVHYSSLAYYPLTFIASIHIYQNIRQKNSFSLFSKILYVFISMIILITSLVFSLFPYLKSFLILKIQDDFAKENLQADFVQWPWLDFIPPLAAILFLLLGMRFLKNKKKKYLYLTSLLQIIWIQTTLYAFVGNIERISQRANIEFFKSLKNKDIYAATFKYKSYAQYFYTECSKATNSNKYNPLWLETGNVDKPVYFSVRKYHIKQFEESVKDAEFLYSNNGFYFYVRNPKK
ncbi:MAG: ArnT family glycosyltransferase [Thermaurantimonas sp.]|uniref:ArnT family glycosyltransferase n=1 Tax=Thermaurantimonas sp. TaxID=2681568 RepID=UPI00391CF623